MSVGVRGGLDQWTRGFRLILDLGPQTAALVSTVHVSSLIKPRETSETEVETETVSVDQLNPHHSHQRTHILLLNSTLPVSGPNPNPWMDPWIPGRDSGSNEWVFSFCLFLSHHILHWPVALYFTVLYCTLLYCTRTCSAQTGLRRTEAFAF